MHWRKGGVHWRKGGVQPGAVHRTTTEAMTLPKEGVDECHAPPAEWPSRAAADRERHRQQRVAQVRHLAPGEPVPPGEQRHRRMQRRPEGARRHVRGHRCRRGVPAGRTAHPAQTALRDVPRTGGRSVAWRRDEVVTGASGTAHRRPDEWRDAAGAARRPVVDHRIQPLKRHEHPLVRYVPRLPTGAASARPGRWHARRQSGARPVT